MRNNVYIPTYLPSMYTLYEHERYGDKKRIDWLTRYLPIRPPLKVSNTWEEPFNDSFSLVVRCYESGADVKNNFRVAELRNAEIEHSDWLFQVTWLFKTNLCALFLLRVSYATLKFVWQHWLQVLMFKYHKSSNDLRYNEKVPKDFN